MKDENIIKLNKDMEQKKSIFTEVKIINMTKPVIKIIQNPEPLIRK